VVGSSRQWRHQGGSTDRRCVSGQTGFASQALAQLAMQVDRAVTQPLDADTQARRSSASRHAAALQARAPWVIQGYWTQLPPEAESTAKARPETAVRIQMGDVTVTSKAHTF
jgi:hypothetical protein